MPLEVSGGGHGHGAGMRRGVAAFLATTLLFGCDPASIGPIADSLPQTVRGQPIHYTEGSVPAMNQDAFYDGAIVSASGDIQTAHLAIGLGRDGSTLSVLLVPGSDARRLVEPFIVDSGLSPTARQVVDVGGKTTLVLILPPTTNDRAYIYTRADTLTVIRTAQPAWAAEALRALP